MGSIITVAQSKGGSAKTATVSCLAPNLIAAGYNVAVVDTDRNRSFADWHGNAYEGPAFPCICEVDHIKAVDVVGAAADQHDVVLVDTAGFENLTAASCISMADFVLVPCMPDRGSVREAMRTAQQVDSLARAARRSIPYRVLLTRWKARGLSERAAVDSLTEAGLAMLAHPLADLADFAKLTFSGTVPTTGKIGDQIGQIIRELVDIGAIPSMPASPANGLAA